ncbi:amino acid permease [Actinosynnema sp. NPDC047251]|uniref:Amino acid permease-associated region n=1 Tax=Saccharothrix espanaensis (strain ATCC 51144 / DSM 44229 / JCM 9112 / NBRC 15066 / NRRL 15764) TaxID=1179773 RepID=K0K6K6_SACES|nr:amino acid permease [Saccharothrix espanaensis]CCH33966.1 Amino acid permease-associated region [Saccharothrix espanaensis DSM 44229]
MGEKITGLTVVQGTAMYVGAVLGTGVIAVPALAAQVAGPASLLAWLCLVMISVPLAATFAALGARFPDAGGVSTYARLAFGERAAAVVGWCFFFAVPSGVTASALFAGSYVAEAAGGGRVTQVGTAVVLLTLVASTNWSGLRASGRVQCVLSGLLLLLVFGAVLLSAPMVDLANLEPFAPNGWTAVGPAAALLVWSFAGWEAITHLAQEFGKPQRDLPRAVGYAVVIVALLYLSVAFATVAVLGSEVNTHAPLGELLSRALGGNLKVFAAIAAVLLTAGSMNAYVAGGAKLGAALSRDGAFPRRLAVGSVRGEVPRRSLALLVGLAFTVLVVVVVSGTGLNLLVLLTTGQFIAVYVIGAAAAVRLLPRRSRARYTAVFALVGVLVLLVVSGAVMVLPALVAVVALLFLRWNRRRRGLLDQDGNLSSVELRRRA